jgi:hypothetical protein
MWPHALRHNVVKDLTHMPESLPETGTQRPEFAHLTSTAQALVYGTLRGRTGFGAFRHFENVFRESLQVVLESSFLVHPKENGWPSFMAHDPEIWHFFGRKMRSNPRVFIEGLLAAPTSFNPKPVWALFWALAKAEHHFLHKYVPYWSHEERLTGHLVSQLIERLEEFGDAWATLNESTEPKSTCRIWYADTAAGRREATTGADLGLIVQAKFRDQDEFFKVVRFQSKKVGRSGNARIDLDQVAALVQRDHLGYYLFYHPNLKNSWSLAPTVRAAKDFERHLTEAQQQQQQKLRRPLGETSVGVQQNGLDLAMFITFAVTDPASEHGVLASDAREAVSVLMSGDAPNPSRVLVVTLGEGATPVEWNETMHEWIGFQFNEE